jgi:hypothetical protein
MTPTFLNATGADRLGTATSFWSTSSIRRSGAPMRAGTINELLTVHVSLAVSAHKDLAE